MGLKHKNQIHVLSALITFILLIVLLLFTNVATAGGGGADLAAGRIEQNDFAPYSPPPPNPSGPGGSRPIMN
ncbi:hypothetical protein Scep_020918 [Stephania cephalantha]|uniref:Uncharacterized protein n=1 Tax=Stephania cephalantha TaxID=152367 RepID=A0AAP0F3C8_9MAGN